MINKKIQKTYIESYYDELTGINFPGAVCYSYGNRNLLIHNGYTILLDYKLTDALKQKKASPDLLFKLAQSNMLDEKEFYNIKQEETIESFIIDITTKCNMACKYCLREKAQKKDSISDLQLENICRYIGDYCHQNGILRIYIQPWGGEPMMEFQKIIYIYDYFASQNIYAHMGIMSNGTILNEKMIDELEKRRIGIGISIDGNDPVQKEQRIFLDGRQSFDIVIKNIEMLKRTIWQDFGIASVITAHTYNHIENIVDFFCKEKEIKNIRMTLVDENTDHGNKDMCLSAAQIRDFYIRYIKKLIEIIDSGYEVQDDSIKSRLLNLMNRSISNACVSNGCMGGRRMVVFDRYGNIFPCKLTDYVDEKLGSIYDGKSLDDILKEARRNNSFFARKIEKSCGICPWNAYCKGGCTCRIKISETEDIDQMECTINHIIYPLLVELILTRPDAVNMLSGMEIM